MTSISFSASTAAPWRALRLIRASLFALALVLFAGCSVFTRPFLDAQGRVLPNSVASMETLQIGGIAQSVWFRGRDTTNPILILLHGGPGASESALFRHYNAALEEQYLVVYWEQRGAGRSYHRSIPPDSMTIAQFDRDLDELVRTVQARFGQRKVGILAHSWGTVIGIRYAFQHPENVSVYVGIAQEADAVEAARLSYEFALDEAVRRSDRRAIEKVLAIGPAPRSADDSLALSNWVERFAVETHYTPSTGRLILSALQTDEANLIDLIKFGQGNRFSLQQLWDKTSKVDLMDTYRSFKVPIVFILGRHDWNVPAVLSARYFARLEAPCKRLFWFEHAGHNPPFDEPERFNRVVNNDILALTRGQCAP